MRKKRYVIIAGATALLGICTFSIHIWQIRADRRQQTRLAETFIEASYAGDIDALLSMFPDCVYERASHLADSENEISELLGNSVTDYVEMIGFLFGEDWEYSAQITERHEYSREERKDLNDSYQMIGVEDASFQKASILTAAVSLSGANDTEGVQTILIPLVKEHGRWYVGQQIGLAYDALATEGEYDIYGSLLNGFLFAEADFDEPE